MARITHRALLLLALLGCERGAGGCGERPLAELLEAKGEVSRDYRGRERAWARAEVGSAFSYGDALRTAKGSLAEVRVGSTGRVMVDSETIIRFLEQAAGQPAGSGLQITQGSATVEARAAALTLRTRGGTALLPPGTKVALKPAAQTDTYRVLMGSVTFHQDDGRTIEVQAGHAIAIGIGLAVLDDEATHEPKPPAAPRAAASMEQPQDAGRLHAAPEPEPEPAAQPQEPSEPAYAANPEDAQQSVREPQPELRVPAGESFEVYDPHPPTRIGIATTERCRDGVMLKVKGARSVKAKDTMVQLALRPGHYRYTLYCLRAKRPGRKLASGRIRVRKANGTRALPRTAPHNSVELDGHRYRLMYQNLRPVIEVSWPSAPAAPSYTLTIETKGDKKHYQTSEPRLILQSNMLRDGKQVLVMQARDAPAHSPPTTLDLRFDNATPTASLELPPVRGFAAGKPVAVQGIASDGTRVSVEGERVKVGARGTFSHTLRPSSVRRALAVRFQHPTHGVRYYVRRTLRSSR